MQAPGGNSRQPGPASAALPEPHGAAIIALIVRGKRARLGIVLAGAATAGPALLAFAACDRQVLHLLPDQGTEAGTPPHEVQDARAQCERSSQCDWPLPSCNLATGRCVGCLDSADCDGAEECDPVTMRCALPCTRENDCRSTQSSPSYLCNESRGFCVECINDADCSSRYDHCDPSGRCTGCDGANCR
jgi:hypothetical protein